MIAGYERTDEDLVLISGRSIATGAEYARRALAAQLRIEDHAKEQLTVSREILAELRRQREPEATPAKPATKPAKPPTP
jgi:hypothetical protein